MTDKEKLEQILDLIVDEDRYRYFECSESGMQEAFEWSIETIHDDDLLERVGIDTMVEYLSYNTGLLIYENEKEVKEEFPDRFEDIIERGGSLYKADCLNLIEKLVEQHGWDYVYEKLGK